MIKTNLFEDSKVRKTIAKKGIFSVLEYVQDLSVKPAEAINSYFAAKMNIRRKQVVAMINSDKGVVLQAGAMQMMLGNIESTTNVKGVGDFFKKKLRSTVTDESAIKPHYMGNGAVVLEPTYKYILLEDLSDWGGAMVIEDGLFLACEDSVEINVTARSSISSAALGHEGLFNTSLEGQGVVALESPVPSEELITVDLNNDTIKIDGSMAIAWSKNLSFTVERSTKTLTGSAMSGEGLVNVYRGTGRILIAPVR